MIDLDHKHFKLREVIEQTGYLSLNSLMFLHWLVRFVQPKYVLELGTGWGCSSIFMALGLGDSGQIITLDHLHGNMAHDVGLIRENFVECGVHEKVEFIQGNSMDSWVGRWPHTLGPEIVFMDASHDSGDLYCEFQQLREILPQDHILVVDDCFVQGVDGFVSGLLRKNEYAVNLVLKYHQGVSVLHTNLQRFFIPVNWAVWRARNG